MRRFLLAFTLSGAAAGMLAARSAHAETIAAGQTVTLSGIATDDTYDIAGTLLVPAYNPADSNSGFVHLRANQINIATTGVISATGSGYAFNVVGGGPGAGVTPADVNGVNEPGGGASHAGLGGIGHQYAAPTSCIVFAAGPGAVYDTTPLLPAALTDIAAGLGSAGGGSNTVNNTTQQPGGSGGGVIILEAAVITIDGVVRAEGRSPTPVLGTGAAGGSGGTIVIRANTFTLGTAGLVTARGAAGAVGNSLGGGGGGGRVLLNSSDDAGVVATQLAQILVTGGDPIGAPNLSGCSATAGAPGMKEPSALATCIDVDGDGHGSALCPAAIGAGDDCNDANDAINPAANETCNGLDDNCDGNADEQVAGAPRLCAEGSACQAGQCVPVADGGPPPVDGGSGDAPELALRGGLCSSGLLGSTSARTGLSVFGLFGLLVAGVIAVRRRRPRV